MPALHFVATDRREHVVEPQGEHGVADRAGITQSLWRIRGNEDGMARRAYHVPARRVVLRKQATKKAVRRHCGLPLDLAAFSVSETLRALNKPFRSQTASGTCATAVIL